MSVVDVWLEDYCKEQLKANNLKLPAKFSFLIEDKDKGGIEDVLSDKYIICDNSQGMITAYLECHHHPDSKTVVIVKHSGDLIKI